MSLIKRQNDPSTAGFFLLLLPFILLIIGVNIIRFAGLENSPPGFHVDELAQAVSVQCLSTEGVDALGNRYPLFADTGYGSPKPPTNFYFTVLWTKMFGFSIASFRAVTGFITLWTILGLCFCSALLFGWRSAVYVAFTASLSPWVFQFSRLALEGGMAMACMVWGVYFFLRSPRWYNAVLAGIMLALAMYSYPSTRLHIPLILGPLLLLKSKRHGIPLRFYMIGAVTMAVTGIPLIHGILTGAYMGRFGIIGIFSEKYLESIGKSRSLIDLTGIFFRHYAMHLHPSFLFLKGDKNFVYGTGFTGLFGWIDTLALALGLVWLTIRMFVRRAKAFVSEGIDRDYLIFLLIAIVTAIIPAALTWQDLPHSMRIIGVWPFLSLFSGYVLWRTSERFPYIWVVPVATALVFSQMYFTHYFKVYPINAYWMFSSITKDRALTARTKEDWLKFLYIYRRQNFHTQYYLMNHMEGQTCSSSRKIWEQFHKLK